MPAVYRVPVQRADGSRVVKYLSEPTAERACSEALFGERTGSVAGPARYLRGKVLIAGYPAEPLSHGFYKLAPRFASELAGRIGKRLPRHGYELQVFTAERAYWLARDPADGRTWTIREDRSCGPWSFRITVHPVTVGGRPDGWEAWGVNGHRQFGTRDRAVLLHWLKLKAASRRVQFARGHTIAYL